MCRYYWHDYKFETRIVRFHNVYGPLGTYDGGKEKAPAAISRKVALANEGDEIEVWGDGNQTRSFMYVDDCVEGLVRIMASDYRDALNLGTDELVTINQLVDIVSEVAGKGLRKRHDLTGRRACVAATATILACSRFWAGSRRFCFAKDSARPIPGLKRSCAGLGAFPWAAWFHKASRMSSPSLGEPSVESLGRCQTRDSRHVSFSPHN